MPHADLVAYCLAKPGAVPDTPWEEDLVAKVGGKIFAFLGGGGVGLKCGRDADEAAELRLRFPDTVTVMAYIGRYGWNRIALDGGPTTAPATTSSASWSTPPTPPSSRASRSASDQPDPWRWPPVFPRLALRGDAGGRGGLRDPTGHGCRPARTDACARPRRPPLRRPSPADPRRLVARSWMRARAQGVDPDLGDPPGPLAADEVELRRVRSPLHRVLPELRAALTSVAEDARHIMVVTDADGVLLWREGSNPVRHRADALGFTEGANWSEGVVGSNAIGTALAEGAPVQMFAAEHFVRTHHVWTCTAFPSTTRAPARCSARSTSAGPPRPCTPPRSRSSAPR